MTPAAFTFESYKFDKVTLNFQDFTSVNVNIRFEPSGIFYKDQSKFDVKIKFSADTADKDTFIEIFSTATFELKNISTIEEIPSFFYRNAIAIFFPYLRAFVSLVTNQANQGAFILPTLNLANLEDPLKSNTIVK